MMDKSYRFAIFLLFLALIFPSVSIAHDAITLERLKQAYPDHIEKVHPKYITWRDGTRMAVYGPIPVVDWLMGFVYHVDRSVGSISHQDVERNLFEPFFKKMYGGTPDEVKRNLVTIYWMPNVFGYQYPLQVTTINGVAQKLQRISAELERLPVSYYKYLENPAGSFYWRRVAGEPYLSAHSFGIAVDINSHYTSYWLWDFLKYKRPVSELSYSYRNQIPERIVQIFEKEGFFWGGRWYFYDTMHFEYRPDLLIPS